VNARVLAEFDDPERLVAAILALRVRGYRDLDAHTPYALPEVEDALALPATRLSWAVLIAGLAGAGGAYGLEWLLNARLYPLNAGGRPPHFPLAFVPITFEMGVLFASFAAVAAVLWLGRVGRLWRPIFEVDGFERAGVDRHWLEVRADAESLAEIEALLDPHRPLAVVRAGGEP
jgi:hypothetical protein